MESFTQQYNIGDKVWVRRQFVYEDSFTWIYGIVDDKNTRWVFVDVDEASRHQLKAYTMYISRACQIKPFK